MWFYGDLTKSHGWAVITGPPLHAETGLWRAPRGGHPSKNGKVWSKSVDGLRCVTESYWKTKRVYKIEKMEETLWFSSTRLGKYWCCCKELRPSSWRSFDQEWKKKTGTFSRRFMATIASLWPGNASFQPKYLAYHPFCQGVDESVSSSLLKRVVWIRRRRRMDECPFVTTFLKDSVRHGMRLSPNQG